MKTVRTAARKLGRTMVNLLMPYTATAYELQGNRLAPWATHRAFTYAGACAWGRLYCANTTAQVRIATRSGCVVGGATLQAAVYRRPNPFM